MRLMRLKFVIHNKDEDQERFTKLVRALTIAHNRYPDTSSQLIDDAGIVQDIEIMFGRHGFDQTVQHTTVIGEPIRQSVYTYSADLCMALSALHASSQSCHSQFDGIEVTLKGLHPTTDNVMPISMRLVYDLVDTDDERFKGKMVTSSVYISIGKDDCQHFSAPSHRFWPVLAALKGIYA